MSGPANPWAPKRFWTEATVAEVPGGFAVRLDARAVKTPAKAPLVLPTRALAEAVAAEWQAQEGTVKPLTMPCTRSANAAIDKTGPQFAEVAAMIAAYGDSDLLCYRAEAPAGLVARQAEGWDPLLGWAAEALAAPLAPRAGIIHAPQPAASLAALSAKVAAHDAFALTALHDLVAISGSLVLGLAVSEGRLDPGAAWALSRIDETWQAELWGEDEEAAAAAAVKRADFHHAARFLGLARG